MNARTYILADNQDISKAGIRFLLKNNGFEGNIAEVSTKKELIKMLPDNSNAVVVLDYTAFDFVHIDDLLVVASRYAKVSWILFSEELSFQFLKRISIENSFSILLKNSSSKEISTALLDAQNNNRYLCPRIENWINSQDAKTAEKQLLTTTEQEILKQIAIGKSVKDIADERSVSVHTITTHKKNIFRKIEVNTTFEASKYALRSGLLDALDYYI
ncbi:MAG: response regulator transcription factor [Dysgonamonadaceae bacterium]|jgi:DNA-binding NarL/FixJ family response regulator|nr:response regulator transcription factor [Dysgonamonadaceae bacterium]